MMKVCIYTNNYRYGFYVHNDQVVGFAILFNSGVSYDSYKLAEIAANAWTLQDEPAIEDDYAWIRTGC